jgi:chemotaxis signal transduction protein
LTIRLYLVHKPPPPVQNPDVVRIPASGLEPPPAVLAGVSAEFIQAVGRDNHKMVILLNMKKIFDFDISSKERA